MRDGTITNVGDTVTRLSPTTKNNITIPVTTALPPSTDIQLPRVSIPHTASPDPSLLRVPSSPPRVQPTLIPDDTNTLPTVSLPSHISNKHPHLIPMDD